MCGISGILRPSGINSLDHHNSRISLNNLNSRGPDNSGISQINQDLIFIHTRLSILDLTEEANQPITSYSGNYVLTYNGEIYNYLELKDLLLNSNINSKKKAKIKETNSDTRVLIELIDYLGVMNSIPLLNGMFAFSLYDKKEKSCITRDYYGQKPLFYSNKSDLIAFSSSLLDCSNLATIKTNLNDKTALQGIQFGMSLLPETLIEDIFEVPPGMF